MSFLPESVGSAPSLRAQRDVDLLHRMGCRACPLAKETANLHPYMDATGAEKPLVYMLGEAPGKVEDELGEQFVGDSGEVLRPLVPKAWRSRVRWNNTINCFPGSTGVLPLGGAQKAFKRWYKGDTVTATTKRGRKITGTPNHPVLTSRGWVALGELVEGNNLLCDARWGYRPTSGTPDVNKAPAPIEQIYGALLESGHVRRVVGSTVNFHGEVPDGDVYVVAAKGSLSTKKRAQIGLGERLKDWFFIVRGKAKCALQGLGLISAQLGWINVRKAVYASVIAKPLTAVFRSVCSVPCQAGLRRGSNYDAVACEVAHYSAGSDTKLLGKRLSADPYFVEGDGVDAPCWPPTSVGATTDDLLFLECSELHTLLDKDVLNSVLAKLESGTKGAQGSPILIETDEVLSISRAQFSGHVYTLQTGQGAFIAEGVIVSNCRPPRNRNPAPTEVECCRGRVVGDIEATKPRAIFGFGNVPLEWAIGQQGITLWRGRRVPIRVGDHTCWYFPMLHPSYLLRSRRGKNRDMPSAEERMFELDVARAFAAVETLPAPRVHTAADVRAGCEIITEGGAEGLRQVRELLEWAAEQDLVGVDYETSSLRPYRPGARILTTAVATTERAVAFPLEHPDAPWSDDELGQVVDMWCDFLRAPRVRRAVHNLAFELEWTGEVFGREYVRAGAWVDTATQAAILDERTRKQKRGPFSLDWLVLQHFGFHLKSLFPELDTAKLADYPVETVLNYNAPDAKYHALLCEAQDALLHAEGLVPAFELANRRPATVVLSQLRGVPVDQDEVRALSHKYDGLIEATAAKIAALPIVRDFRQERGEDFNPLSNPHVHHVFVAMLDRPECRITDKRTGKEKLSADESILSNIDHPLSGLILDYRHYNKRKSTYVDPLLVGSPILYDDGCLHTNYNTFRAATGRMSSDGPNVQNFPKRDGEAVEVRRPIRAPQGYVILAFDYGQLEARVIAMLSGDEYFIRTLWERYDVHADWAQRIAAAYPQRVGGRRMLGDKKAMKTFRTDIKNQWTFPLFFGARLLSAAGYLGVPEDAIADLYDEFWEEFSGIRDWQERVEDFYDEHGYVECATGRRRRGPLSLNKIINTPVQGTAAELVMDAMCRLSETEDPDLQPELNIHDDLSFLRVPENRVDEVAEKVLDYMLDTPFEWARTVPITVEMACGKNWMPYDKVANPEGLKDVGTYSSDDWFG